MAREAVTSSQKGQSLVPEQAARELRAGRPQGASRLPGGGLTPAPCPPGRYLYNRMGYWSDWSVPILMATAAAFTYIAGLQVREAASEGGGPVPRGREAWPVPG